MARFVGALAQRNFSAVALYRLLWTALSKARKLTASPGAGLPVLLPAGCALRCKSLNIESGDPACAVLNNPALHLPPFGVCCNTVARCK
jgi:hypothetical protein